MLKKITAMLTAVLMILTALSAALADDGILRPGDAIRALHDAAQHVPDLCALVDDRVADIGEEYHVPLQNPSSFTLRQPRYAPVA